MGNRQSKQNKKTKESPRRDKPTKKRLKRVKAEPSEALQRSTGASSWGYDVQAPILSIVVEPRSSKKDTTIANTPKPQAATTTQASSLSLEPSETTTNVAKSDDKIREGTREDFEPEAGLEPHPVTTTQQALSLSQGPNRTTNTAEKDDENNKGTQEGPEPECISLESELLPVQSVDIIQQSEAITTPPAVATVLDSNREEQAVVEVEEKKLLTVSDTHSVVATAPESSGATAEATREDKHGKETQEESKSATQETLIKHKPRAQDGGDHASSKKPIWRKRHKRTGCHGEHLL